MKARLCRVLITAIAAAALTLSAAGQVRPQGAAGGRQTPPPLVKPVLEVVMGEPQYRDMVKSLKLDYRSSVAVPTNLSFYSCVILNNDNAVRPNITERMKAYLRSGGGLVVTGTTPYRFISENRMNTGDDAFKSIVEWFGCSGAHAVQFDMYWNQWPGVPATMLTKTDNAFGTGLPQDTVLLRYRGNANYLLLDRTDEFCEVVAYWHGDHINDPKERNYPTAFFSSLR